MNVVLEMPVSESLQIYTLNRIFRSKILTLQRIFINTQFAIWVFVLAHCQVIRNNNEAYKTEDIECMSIRQ